LSTVSQQDQQEALLRGIAAAPEASEADAWLALVGVTPDQPEAAVWRRRKAAVVLADPTAPGDRAPRLAALRAELARRQLDGLIVPRADQHQGEYVPLQAQRLAWLTGFTGSAGLALVLTERAALFVDGRYTLQARAETAAHLFEYHHLMEEPLAGWLHQALPQGGRIGYDPWLHPLDWVEKLREAAGRHGLSLIACPDNPLDAVWPDQPPPPLAPVVPHELSFAGRASADKRAELAATLEQAGVAAVVLTQPETIAWLLNLRGGDVPHAPLPLAFALVDQQGRVELFIDRRKLLPATLAHLGEAVRVRPPEALGPALEDLGRSGRKVQLDPTSAAAWLFDRLHQAGARVVRASDPCALPKAVRNPVESAGIRAAHRRDGVAMVRFLHWLEHHATDGQLTELEAARQLLEFRRQGQHFRGLSFETIAGAGIHGAIVHYHATAASNARLEPDSLFLVDSGAQYLDGTTDVTRTMAIGSPDAEMRRCYTLVLQGHILLAETRFPEGTTGSQLDALARRPLWQAGLDYDHGTGHGVGSYLSVHEGPQRISKAANSTRLTPGMVLSLEPGYYREGAFGIRLENLVQVVRLELDPAAERPMLALEALTLVPFDRRLIDSARLEPWERRWLDRYHQRVRQELLPLLEGAAAQWLMVATEPLQP